MILVALALAAAATLAPSPRDSGWQPSPPKYAHVVAILEENKSYDQVIVRQPLLKSPAWRRVTDCLRTSTRKCTQARPTTSPCSAATPSASTTTTPSTARQARSTPLFRGSAAPGYVNHKVHGSHLGAQLEQAGMNWKGYYETIPAPGSLAITASDSAFDDGSRKTALYASKLSGFLNLASVQTDPHRAEKIVGFDQLVRDIADDRLPPLRSWWPTSSTRCTACTAPTSPPTATGPRTWQP